MRREQAGDFALVFAAAKAMKMTTTRKKKKKKKAVAAVELMTSPLAWPRALAL